MRTSMFTLVLGLLVASCGGGGGGPETTASASLTPLCQPRPATAGAGCFATPSSTLCAPSGCQSLCAAADTPVTCTSDGPTGPIPAPDAAAGCTIVPIPTPSSELYYCCPCGGR